MDPIRNDVTTTRAEKLFIPAIICEVSPAIGKIRAHKSIPQKSGANRKSGKSVARISERMQPESKNDKVCFLYVHRREFCS